MKQTIVKKKKEVVSGCFYNKTADEMFEELGYIEQMYYDNNILFRTESSHCLGREIHFNLIRKAISLPRTIKFEELQAINKKVEELGWK